jgi:hypothetical protein
MLVTDELVTLFLAGMHVPAAVPARVRDSGTGPKWAGTVVTADTLAPSYGCHAAFRKRARAFFPSLAASAMLSKKTAERSTGPDLPAR